MSPFSLGILGSARVGALGLPVTDTFTRSDNTTSIGDAETGHPWVTAPSDAAGISGNMLKWNNYTDYGSNRKQASALVDAGTTDVTVSATFGANLGGKYEVLVARLSAHGTQYHLQHQNANSDGYLVRTIGSTTGFVIGDAVISTGKWCPSTTHTHSLTVREESGSTRLIVYTDGVQRYSGLDSTTGRPMGTMHGVGAFTTTAGDAWPFNAYVDDFSVTSPAY